MFPKGKFSAITAVPYEKELVHAEALVLRIESLGPDHQLFPYMATIREKMAQSRNSIKVYKEAVLSEKAAFAEEKIAQAALRHQYEQNYLSARKELGKILAEKLFTKSTSKRKSSDIITAA